MMLAGECSLLIHVYRWPNVGRARVDSICIHVISTLRQGDRCSDRGRHGARELSSSVENRVDPFQHPQSSSAGAVPGAVNPGRTTSPALSGSGAALSKQKT